MSNSRNLGVEHGKLAPMPSSPNAISTQTDDQSKKVDALPMSGGLQQTKDKIRNCLSQLGGNQIVTEDDLYLHAVFVTPLLRFKDDVEFYIDESAQLVHFRSASRLGYSDFGANRKRYNAFRATYSG